MMMNRIKNRPLFYSVISGVLLVAIGAGVHVARKHYYSIKPIILYAWRLPSGPIFITEDPHNTRLQKYAHQERLDQVTQPYKTDFEKILALSQWASRQFIATSPLPNYPPWDAIVILDRIRRGKTGGFCAQYAFIFGQACQSAGYIPRYVDLASPENNGGHFTTEVYVPSLKKWVVFEAERGVYYVDTQGHPLSAMELHQWAVGKRSDPVLRLPTKEKVDHSWIRLFYYFRYYLRNNFLSVPVFLRQDGGQFGFEPYRLAWSDLYTSNKEHMANAIASTDVGDFEYTLRQDVVPEMTWHQRGDFYKTLTSVPPYQMCKIIIPNFALVRLVKQDLVHNPAYHRLKA